jgi:dTDP-4-amino-4,6-dideoxygalactose transaminase
MSERDFRLYCTDILDSGSAILEFVKGLSFEEFCSDRKTYSAVIREAEAAYKQIISLPIFSCMTDIDVENVIVAVLKVLEA